MSAIFDYIDLGNYDNKAIPYSERKSIALLLGAGFSAPMGYPIGNDMNEYLLNFDDRNVDFSPSGVLASSIDGTKPNFQIGGVLNNHQKYFVFCKKLIKEYAQKHGNRFDYEEFFDFIKSDEPKDKDYQRLLLGLCEERELYEEYLYNVPHIYNQMVAHLLKDKTGKTWYDDEPFKMNYFDGYTTKRLPANLLQAQRDYFGAHTYERIDEERGKFFHTNWTGHGGDTASSTYNV